MTLDQLLITFKYPSLIPRHLAVLFILYEKKMLSRDMAKALKIPRASTCRAFDSLSINKLIKRERDHKDKRNVYGVITDQGRRLVEELRQ